MVENFFTPHQIHLEGHCHPSALAGADLGIWDPDH